MTLESSKQHELGPWKVENVNESGTAIEIDCNKTPLVGIFQRHTGAPDRPMAIYELIFSGAGKDAEPISLWLDWRQINSVVDTSASKPPQVTMYDQWGFQAQLTLDDVTWAQLIKLKNIDVDESSSRAYQVDDVITKFSSEKFPIRQNNFSLGIAAEPDEKGEVVYYWTDAARKEDAKFWMKIGEANDVAVRLLVAAKKFFEEFADELPTEQLFITSVIQKDALGKLSETNYFLPFEALSSLDTTGEPLSHLELVSADLEGQMDGVVEQWFAMRSRELEHKILEKKTKYRDWAVIATVIGGGLATLSGLLLSFAEFIKGGQIPVDVAGFDMHRLLCWGGGLLFIPGSYLAIQAYDSAKNGAKGLLERFTQRQQNSWKEWQDRRRESRSQTLARVRQNLKGGNE